MINNKNIIFLALIFLLLTWTCNTRRIANNKKAYIKYANENFKSDFTINFNEDSTYVLCVKKYLEDNTNPNKNCEYFVMNLKNNNIEFQNKIHSAHVSWHSKLVLKIEQQLGIKTSITDNGKSVSFYNIKTKRKQNYNNSIKR